MVSEGGKKREIINEREVMHNDSLNGDSRRTLRNKNDGASARAVHIFSNNTWEGLDYTLKIGITGSNYTDVPDSGNCGFIQNDSPDRFRICNLMNAPHKFSINFTNDRSLENVTDIMEITKDNGYLKLLHKGVIQLKETTTPDAEEDYGAVYPKADNKLYFQNGAGAESEISLENLGEVKMFALSISGAVTKASLQTKGWAICDGTTPVSQGITSPVLSVTPDLKDKFIRMSNDEKSGGIGGEAEHTLNIDEMPAHKHDFEMSIAIGTGTRARQGDGYNATLSTTIVGGGQPHNNLPPYYELALFIKVK